MHPIRPSLLLAIAAASFALPAQAQVKLGTVLGMDITTDGMLQVDGNWYDNDVADLDGRDDGRDRATGIRRSEFGIRGKAPGGFDWVVAYDFEAEKFLDTNIGFSFPARADGSTHRLQLGQFKQPHSLEELSSSKNNDFIAKAAATATFATGRRLGVGYAYEARDLGASLSWFGRELTDGQAEGAGFAARGYWAPVNAEGNVLHLGLSRVDRDTADDSLRLRARPNADFSAVRVVDTGGFTDADRIATTGLEAMWIRGPIKLQGEVHHVDVERLVTGNYSGSGGYASAVWNVGGETWGYRGGLPRTASPGEDRFGMWQLGLRYDRLDLDDGGVAGGRMDAWTVGANWYWRKHLKLMLNYVRVDSERAGVADDPDIVEARVQVHW